MYRTPRLAVSAALLIAVGLAGCASSLNAARWTHAQYGTVPADHAQLVTIRDMCGAQAYSQGVVLNKQTLVSRKIALKALAVREDSPVLANNPPDTFATGKTDPAFVKRVAQLEKETWACVEAAGWRTVDL